MSFESSVERSLDRFFNSVCEIAENHKVGKDRVIIALQELAGTDLAEQFEEWYAEGED